MRHGETTAPHVQRPICADRPVESCGLDLDRNQTDVPGTSPFDAQAHARSVTLAHAWKASPMTPLFAQVLGASYVTLPEKVREAHDLRDIHRFRGFARITRGTRLLPRAIAWVFRFPQAHEQAPVEVSMRRVGETERWTRVFNGAAFESTLQIRNGLMTERFGWITFRLGLFIRKDALHFPVTGARLGWLPLPAAFLPRSIALETERDGRFVFDVRIEAPITGALIVHYQGWLEPEG